MSDILPFTAKSLEKATAIWCAGGLVAFPTETVYGLGADARDDRVVARIFKAKNRPAFNPLIVHIADIEKADMLALMSPLALKLADAFWPGPLTMILPMRPDNGLSPLVSAGLSTIALRIPAHKIARQLLLSAAMPIAAPSANASGKISPTKAWHVRESLSLHRNKAAPVDLILDGGPCSVGLESTIVNMSIDPPVIVRAGAIIKEDIMAISSSDILVHKKSLHDDTAPVAPGLLSRHYAPDLPLRLNAQTPLQGEAYIGFGLPRAGETSNLSISGNLAEAASRLFGLLHELDGMTNYQAIAVAPIPDRGIGIAINDRLKRAATPHSPASSDQRE